MLNLFCLSVLNFSVLLSCSLSLSLSLLSISLSLPKNWNIFTLRLYFLKLLYLIIVFFLSFLHRILFPSNWSVLPQHWFILAHSKESQSCNSPISGFLFFYRMECKYIICDNLWHFILCRVSWVFIRWVKQKCCLH